MYGGMSGKQWTIEDVPIAIPENVQERGDDRGDGVSDGGSVRGV